MSCPGIFVFHFSLFVFHSSCSPPPGTRRGCVVFRGLRFAHPRLSIVHPLRGCLLQLRVIPALGVWLGTLERVGRCPRSSVFQTSWLGAPGQVTWYGGLGNLARRVLRVDMAGSAFWKVLIGRRLCRICRVVRAIVTVRLKDVRIYGSKLPEKRE